MKALQFIKTIDRLENGEQDFGDSFSYTVERVNYDAKTPYSDYAFGYSIWFMAPHKGRSGCYRFYVQIYDKPKLFDYPLPVYDDGIETAWRPKEIEIEESLKPIRDYLQKMHSHIVDAFIAEYCKEQNQ